jgi:hypothetical protein
LAGGSSTAGCGLTTSLLCRLIWNVAYGGRTNKVSQRRQPDAKVPDLVAVRRALEGSAALRRPLRAAAARLREDLLALVVVQPAEAVDLEAVFLQ